MRSENASKVGVKSGSTSSSDFKRAYQEFALTNLSVGVLINEEMMLFEWEHFFFNHEQLALGTIIHVLAHLTNLAITGFLLRGVYPVLHPQFKSWPSSIRKFIRNKHNRTDNSPNLYTPADIIEQKDVERGDARFQGFRVEETEETDETWFSDEVHEVILKGLYLCVYLIWIILQRGGYVVAASDSEFVIQVCAWGVWKLGCGSLSRLRTSLAEQKICEDRENPEKTGRIQHENYLRSDSESEVEKGDFGPIETGKGKSDMPPPLWVSVTCAITIVTCMASIPNDLMHETQVLDGRYNGLLVLNAVNGLRILSKAVSFYSDNIIG